MRVDEKTFSVLTVSKRPQSEWLQIAKQSIGQQTVNPEKWVIIQEGVNSPQKVRASNLNASLNAGLRQIESSYVIFYQDFIQLPNDCFEKLIILANERTFVTTCTPNYDGSNDSRYSGANKARRCRPEEWESNVAIAPMAILRALGGFEEELDNGWAWDNVHLAQRAAMLGCKFICDESNRPKLLPHELVSKEKLPLNAEYCARDIKAIREGRKPLKLNYL